jgi:hypothetical protein
MKLLDHNGEKFWASDAQASAIELLQETKTGFATVHGYVSTSGYVSPQTADINFITKFNVMRVYERAIAALCVIKFDDVADELKKSKFGSMAVGDLKKAFEDRIASEIASMQKTLDGDRSDAHREAHDRNYINLAPSVKVHLKTEKDGEIRKPILYKGYPIVESIMIGMIEIGRTITEAGEYKAVNNGLPVTISNIIKSKLPRSAKLKFLSLKEDNFKSISVGGTEIVPDDIAGMFTW